MPNTFIDYVGFLYNISYKLEALKKLQLHVPYNFKAAGPDYIARDIID